MLHTCDNSVTANLKQVFKTNICDLMVMTELDNPLSIE